MRDIIFIQACPIDSYFIWQTHLWLESLRKLGLSNKAVSLIFIPAGREKGNKWDKLVETYPESEFFFQKDEDNISKFLPVYIPVLRPYILSKYFKLHPELKEKAIFYCDADVVFTENFNISHLINDNICYLSDTKSYINSDYFDRKQNDVLPDKLEAYKKRDILNEACTFVGIFKQIAEENKESSGGAQYLLKNIDAEFWEKVTYDCIVIRKHLLNTNAQFFENESKGFQSWCADMWAVLWNLWFKNLETKIIPEMEFAWSTDDISKLKEVGILHNAGITGDFHKKRDVSYPVFNKSKYISGRNPLSDPHLIDVLNSEETKKTCNHYYLQLLFEAYNKYKIEYGT